MRIASYIIGVLMLVACSAGDTSEEHYRRGRMLAGQNRSAEAMREYLLAVDVADDTQAVMKAVSELGHLSLNQHNLSQARNYFEQSWQLAVAEEDLVQMVLAQRDLGRCCRVARSTAESLLYFARADSLLTAAGADSLRVFVYPEYISLLLGEGRADEARRLYLSEIASEEADWERAYNYALECAALVDSAKLLMQAENANLVDSLSDQLEVERENYRLYRIIAFITLVAIVLIALSVFFVRERIARLKRQQEKERQASVSRARNRQEQLIETFRNTGLYRKVLVDESISSEQWEEIVQFLNAETDGFVDKLTTFYPAIKPQEMQVCQLLKLEFTNQQIATILCKTQQAITNLRKRLYQKMFEKEGTADELNQFLRLFPQEKGL